LWGRQGFLYLGGGGGGPPFLPPPPLLLNCEVAAGRDGKAQQLGNLREEEGEGGREKNCGRKCCRAASVCEEF